MCFFFFPVVDGILRMRIDTGFTCTQKLLAALFLYVTLHIFASCVYNRLSGTSIRPLPMSNLTFPSTYYLIGNSRLVAARRIYHATLLEGTGITQCLCHKYLTAVPPSGEQETRQFQKNTSLLFCDPLGSRFDSSPDGSTYLLGGLRQGILRRRSALAWLVGLHVVDPWREIGKWKRVGSGVVFSMTE
ncbi:unnamed protein product [Schistocephalus solidus]|uniref:Uncharacterized protein n=1 Tax=Schistocephalus solidus TaxID=70667 RepID=A0A183T8D1_SCHSO|nr:unnamed protein product [Schistocephalus solidus]